MGTENYHYEGDLFDGKAHGYGVLYYENGNIWYDDLMHGEGVYYSEKGELIHKGRFEKGEIVE